MLITRSVVAAHLLDFLMPEDRKHFDLIADLSWAAAITLEFGFQSPKSQQKNAEKKFFELIQKLSEARTKAGVRIKKEEYDYTPTFPNEGHLPSINDIAVVCDLFHKLVVRERKLSKEKMLEWMKGAWDMGVRQKKVYSMETEGGVMNQYGIVAEFGARLAMRGTLNGFLPE